MTALNELRQESTLAKSLIERLDRLSVRCMSSGDGLKKATRLLSLANFYGLIAEHQRAGRCWNIYREILPSAELASASVRHGVATVLQKVPVPGIAISTVSHLQKLQGCSETGEPDLALEELLEHASTLVRGQPGGTE